jgi:hypothetical protein
MCSEGEQEFIASRRRLGRSLKNKSFGKNFLDIKRYSCNSAICKGAGDETDVAMAFRYASSEAGDMTNE